MAKHAVSITEINKIMNLEDHLQETTYSDISPYITMINKWSAIQLVMTSTNVRYQTLHVTHYPGQNLHTKREMGYDMWQVHLSRIKGMGSWASWDHEVAWNLQSTLQLNFKTHWTYQK
jgi:hypothetical protein